MTDYKTTNVADDTPTLQSTIPFIVACCADARCCDYDPVLMRCGADEGKRRRDGCMGKVVALRVARKIAAMETAVATVEQLEARLEIERGNTRYWAQLALGEEK